MVLSTSFKILNSQTQGLWDRNPIISSPIITGYLLKGHINKKNYWTSTDNAIMRYNELNQKVT